MWVPQPFPPWTLVWSCSGSRRGGPAITTESAAVTWKGRSYDARVALPQPESAKEEVPQLGNFTDARGQPRPHAGMTGPGRPARRTQREDTMDQERFDAIARELGAGFSRRRLARLLGVGMVAVGLRASSAREVAAGTRCIADGENCTIACPSGSPCNACCNGFCAAYGG